MHFAAGNLGQQRSIIPQKRSGYIGQQAHAQRAAVDDGHIVVTGGGDECVDNGRVDEHVAAEDQRGIDEATFDIRKEGSDITTIDANRPYDAGLFEVRKRP